ncbi:fasciclin domain-containing protein [Bacteroidota bacterium]
MHTKIIPILFILITGLSSCNKSWDDHYNNEEGSVNQNLWETITAIPEYSDFTNYMVEYELDSVFRKGNSLTLFIPTNEAFKSFNPDTGDISSILRFHMMNYVFNTVVVSKTKMAETSAGKFVQIEFNEGTYQYNGINISYFSPLYKDGRFYTIDEVAIPKPNLYEFIAQTSLPLKNFIDNYDSVILDYELSKPLGFDDDGNVIYDSVYTVVNFFDSIYFSVKQEDRNKSATFITFSEEQYINALDLMAQDLTGDYNTAEDIPKSWQDEVFLTDMVNKGLFQNTLLYEDLQPKMKNVRGDTVFIDPSNIDPDSRVLASNGVLFSYIDFKVPDYLYRKEIKIEGEHLIDSAAGFYIWNPELVTYDGSPDALSVFPQKFGLPANTASNDSSVNLQFPSFNYTGDYQLEFYFRNMFPMRYLFVWGASYNPSGIWSVLVNDIEIKRLDLFELRSTVHSVMPDVYYFPNRSGYNAFDAWVDHITEFGDIKITLKYIGPSEVNRTNGINIDYISLIPDY